MNDNVLVIGAILLDTKGKPHAGLEPNTSNPAGIRSTRGGTARNVAENLALLGADVTLISAVGDDVTGRRLLIQTADSGVNLDPTLIIEGENTGAYIAILDPDGSLSVALDDVDVMRHITPEYLYQQERLFAQASMVVMDGSLTQEAMEMVVKLALQYEVPLCADPSSTRLAYKLRPYFPHLHLVVPNEVEAAELCEVDYEADNPDLSLELARQLVKMGVDIAVVTLADFGINYVTSDETGTLPARYSEMVDSTGTGDAITAAIIFGLINNLPAIEALRLGVAAAALTLQTVESVVPDLSLDMLYEHLIV